MRAVKIAVCSLLVVAASNLHAQETAAVTVLDSSPVVRVQSGARPRPLRGVISRRSARTSPQLFGRVIELERRKNAWLRRSLRRGR